MRAAWPGYALALLAVAIVSVAIGLVGSRTPIANVSMLYLLAVLAAASRFGSGPAVVAAISAFLVFDWFFIEPLHTFSVAEQEWFALVLFLITAVITGELAAGQRRRATEAEQRERDAVLLYEVTRTLGDPDPSATIGAVAERLYAALPLRAVTIEVDGARALRAAIGDEAALATAAHAAGLPALIPDVRQTGTSGWVRRLPPASIARAAGAIDIHVVPIGVAERRAGALVAVPRDDAGRLRASDARLLSAVAAQIANAVERSRLREAATQAEVLRRADDLKSGLLNAVSHDLRTPLASIVASAGSLRQRDVEWTDEERTAFLNDIEQEARRLGRIVGNLLDLSRVEAGVLRPERGWYDLGALVDDVLGRLRPQLASHRVRVEIPDDLPPVPLDYVEIDEVLTNLIENAVHHTEAGTQLAVRVRREDDRVEVEVADDGPGIPGTLLASVFEPFARARSRKGPAAGTGLGLAVARGLVEAHGGRIDAHNRSEGGASFTFTLPLDPEVTVRPS